MLRLAPLNGVPSGKSKLPAARPVDELRSSRSNRVAQAESLRGMRSLEHFQQGK